jgi:ribosomal protein L7/L12
MDESVIFAIVILLLAVVVAVRRAHFYRTIADLAKRQTRTEAKVDLLLKQAGITYDPHANVPPGVVEALRAGKKIEAIRQYRMATGADLKEAKEFVESL